MSSMLVSGYWLFSLWSHVWLQPYLSAITVECTSKNPDAAWLLRHRPPSICSINVTFVSGTATCSYTATDKFQFLNRVQFLHLSTASFESAIWFALTLRRFIHCIWYGFFCSGLFYHETFLLSSFDSGFSAFSQSYLSSVVLSSSFWPVLLTWTKLTLIQFSTPWFLPKDTSLWSKVKLVSPLDKWSPYQCYVTSSSRAVMIFYRNISYYNATAVLSFYLSLT